MAGVVETVQIAARIPADLSDQLSQLATERERTVSQELRLAIKAHIEQAAQEAAA